MTRKFRCFDDYSEYYDDHEHKMNDVDIVENELTVSADGEFECKSCKVAIRRFFKALAGDNRFDGWYECIRECVENGYYKEKATIYNHKTGREEYILGGYHWSVEPTIEDCWYVELTVGK